AGEGCDVGSDPSAGCVDCQVTAGWTCVGLMPSSCELRECGDGTRTVDEGCDDGNLDDEDGCSAECVVEEGWRCTSSGCTPVCGDGMLMGLEECDDGNRQRADGCSTICRVEPFWECEGEPSTCESTVVCGDYEVGPGEICDPPGVNGCLPGCESFNSDITGAPVCGNEVIEAGETCDPPAVGLGCGGGCLAEPGYVCPRPHVCILLPVCGNGIRQAGEECDVDPAHPSAGCVGCEVTDGWFCYGMQPDECEQPICGNGVREGTEECDDDDATPTSGDGCSATCTLETGWTCPTADAPCRPICGDGLLRGGEQCEDNDTVPTSGDGCNAACRIEQGWDCPTIGGPCEENECPNGDQEPGEGCDDGNAIAGDGCGPTCQNEPSQFTGGDGREFAMTCGDGMVTGTEECDDGNSDAGDGCSASCEVEDGFLCDEDLTLPGNVDFLVTYRDFKGTNESGGHPHMKRTWQDAPNDTPPYSGDDRGIVGAVCTAANQASCGRLNSVGNPQLAAYTNLQTQHPTIYWHPEDFDMWYGTTTSGTGQNGAIQVAVLDGVLPLTHGSGESYSFSDSTFFPLNGVSGSLGATPGQGTNDFHFTTVLRYFFQYKGGENLTFTGDDDVWVYINGRLGIDIGGIHVAETTAVTLASGSDARFAITTGHVYEIVLFHAERHPTASNFNLTLAGFLAPRSYCEPICGDGVVAGWEVCDEGTANNTGAYGHCNADCTAIQFCGDGIRQNAYEACENGRNIDVYGGGSNACAPGCVIPGRCGDGVLQGAFEACDLGAGNTATAYGVDACTTTCQLGGWCGDDVINGGEYCDDGPLNGTAYGATTCSFDCLQGPYCGDGIRNGAEECDGGELCDECALTPYCGDGLVSAD
ncbi:MAG TPA: DUF4215 domain-containing protein, partial [Polyangiaceae bacterium]|nr:DUF4215 domain-containing protein [Polyangiaceae bacterium]